MLVLLKIYYWDEFKSHYFKRFNYLRNNVGAIEKFRVEISQGRSAALKLLNQLQSLEVHIQGIGDDTNKEVHGFKQLKASLGKYGMSYNKRAVDLFKFHIEKGNWTSPIDGSMIFGLAAAYHFANFYLGDSQKVKSFNSKNKVSLGFYGSLLVFLVFVIFFSRSLYFAQDIIVRLFPNSEFYLNYFFENMRNIFDIWKSLISNY